MPSVAAIIRPEAPDDFDAIHALVAAAFGQGNEAELVRRLRASDVYLPELALVAEVDGVVTGHVLISYVTLLNDDEEFRVLSLAPLAVTPERQGQGIGGALVEAGLKIADERGEPLVVLLGHPAYYPRFGFEIASGHGIEPPYDGVADAAFMVGRLSAYDERYRGRIVYPPAFDIT